MSIHAIECLDFTIESWRWEFANERKADIAAHFASLRARLPQIWNGRVLLMHEHQLVGRRLTGRWFETDYADFIAWRDWGCPDRGIANCFAMGALRGSDGGFLLGVMGNHTMNADRVYFPCGTPDPEDIHAGRVDLDGSVLREVAEETGLFPGDFVAAPDWIAVTSGPRIALIKILESALTAHALRERILGHLAREAQPELADIRIVRAPGDLDAKMPEFVTAFLVRSWAA